MGQPLYLGIDVGTGSARAGLFDRTGRRLASASRPIRMWRPLPDHVEQSSDDIWSAVCAATREALAAAGPGVTVRGIGFDATCSLVALDRDHRPVSLSSTGEPAQNVIVWMDHRAAAEAAELSATEHPVLKYVGGTLSPEMQTPKLLWLKRHLPGAFARAALFLDLPDFLTFRATGSTARSLCTTVCKWTYLGHEGRWDESYFERAGLSELARGSFAAIGSEVLPMGTSVGTLTRAAAADLGLPAGVPVSASIIDAHAGGVGSLGAGAGPLTSRVALIAGTSACHMAVSASPLFVPGVWGPYFSAMIPGLWLSEAGQSAAGALFDHLIPSHPGAAAAAAEAAVAGVSLFELLESRCTPATREAVRHLHVYPDLLGNRAPLADPHLGAAVVGLHPDTSVEALYLAAVQSLAHSTRQILAALRAAGHDPRSLVACGGLAKSRLYLQEHADICGLPVTVPAETESVLLGSAVLGAVASGDFPDLPAAMAAMTAPGHTLAPATDASAFHDAKHAVFLILQRDQLAYRRAMAV